MARLEKGKEKIDQEKQERTGFLGKGHNHICFVEDNFGSDIDNWFWGKVEGETKYSLSDGRCRNKLSTYQGWELG